MSNSSSECDIHNVSNVTLHAGAMYYKKSERHSWEYVWGLLRANKVFFLFTSDEANLENHIGTIHLDKDTSFVCSDKTHNGFSQFKLLFAKRKDKKYKFQVNTVYERELWRAYIVGVTKGSIPNDVILSPKDIQLVAAKLRPVPQDYHPSPSQTHPHVHLSQQSFSDSSGSSTDMQPRGPGTPPEHSPYPTSNLQTSSSGSLQTLLVLDSISHKHRRGSEPHMTKKYDGASIRTEEEARFQPRDSACSKDSGLPDDYLDGGPTMRHKFTMDDDGRVPPWFFENCDRESANKILVNNPQIGNTLMRVSTSARNTGSYVISSSITLTNGNTELVHYEVARVAAGFQIKVENCTTALNTLTEVMDRFATLAGRQSTRLMTTNRLDLLLPTGSKDETDYSSRIIPAANPAASPTNESDPEHLYEMPRDVDPSLAPPTPCSRVHPAPVPAASAPDSAFVPVAPPLPPIVPPTKAVQQGSMTLNRTRPGTASGKCQYGSGGKTVGYSVGPSDHGSSIKGKQSIKDIEQRMSENDAIRRLDSMLKTEESGSLEPSHELPPALPPVPENRPRLTLPDVTNSWQHPPNSGAAPAPWERRRQTEPNVDVRGLNIKSPNVMDELQEKLLKRRMKSESDSPNVSEECQAYEAYNTYQNLP